jgi:ribosomal protein S18 acetylase RimI-like enzyme
MSIPLPVAPAITSAVEPERAIATLVVAFGNDPITRWFLHEGSIDTSGPDAGAALWHAPGTELDDESLVGLMHSTVEPERHEPAFSFLAQMADQDPTEPHWYLPFIGVDPTCQGQGHGSRLLEQGLARCDRDGLPADLDAITERTRDVVEAYRDGDHVAVPMHANVAIAHA